MKQIEFSVADIQILAQYLRVPKEREGRLISLFQQNPYKLLKRARFALPLNIKSKNWLFLILKEKLQIELSEEETSWLRLIELFQIDDVVAVRQGLNLLEGMCSLEQISQFFDIDLVEILWQDGLCFSGSGNASLYRSMSWLQAEPALAGYVFLWFLALLYTETPDAISWEQGGFYFLPPEANPYIDYRKSIQFSVIPQEFYQISSIQKLLLPRELHSIPPELLCMPNLRELELKESVEGFDCLDYGQLSDSQISLVRIQNQEQEAAKIPKFIWYLPQMKRLILENMGYVSIPPISEVEELEVYSDLRKSNLNIKPSLMLRKIVIFLKYRKLDWEWELPNLEEISLLSVGQFKPKEARALRKISLKGADGIILGALPNLEEFSLGYFHKSYQPNTDALLLSLQQAPNLRRLIFASGASSWSVESSVWSRLECLDISGWINLENIEGELDIPQLHTLCCNIQQLRLSGLPKNMRCLYLQQVFAVSVDILEETKKFLQSFIGVEELLIECPDFPLSTENFQSMSNLQKLVINGQRIK